MNAGGGSKRGRGGEAFAGILKNVIDLKSLPAQLPDKFKAVVGTSSGGSFLTQTLFVCDSPGGLLGSPHQQDRL